MYQHILIPTDGSELAEHAVTHGLSLAKSVGAKVTVIIVEEPWPPFAVGPAALVPLGTYAEEMKKLAASALNRAANAAKQADVSCNTLQVGDAPPYQAIIARPRTRAAISLLWHRMAAADYPRLFSAA
jgi:nucleotide-binding universal stress UspA family protein